MHKSILMQKIGILEKSSRTIVYNAKPLSIREQQILRLVAYEYTTNMIAEKLYLSPHTVISHRNNLMQKLYVTNSAGLVRRGFEIGVLPI